MWTCGIYRGRAIKERRRGERSRSTGSINRGWHEQRILVLGGLSETNIESADLQLAKEIGGYVPIEMRWMATPVKIRNIRKRKRLIVEV